jgi:predicted RecA/RadA family phage recombinase
MKNYVQAGDNLTVTAPKDVAAGGGVLVGKIFGVAQAKALTGEQVTIVRKGVFDLAKLSTGVWSPGDKIYWDDAAAECTKTTTSNTLVGAAVQAAANPTATGLVLLDGTIRV